MEAIILAGGLGTRLRAVVSNVPKPMAPIMGIPFLEYIFRYLKKNNINKVVLSVCYKRDTIIKYFSDTFFDISIKYSVEEEPLGTGGAIKQSLKFCNNENILLLNGDTFFNVNLDALFKSHLNNLADLTLCLKPMCNFDRYGIVKLDSANRVIGFNEKKYCENGLINGGLYIIRKNFLDNEDVQKFSFEDFMNKNYKEKKIYGVIDNGYFIDVGIPEDYYKAQKELKYVI